ncbi:MAG: hypothetical protein IPG24_13965 [Leptospiraceae bacterium]|jgi:hypothetical protein|nr:hypothetical protein [Leptospiraceae bacterium]
MVTPNKRAISGIKKNNLKKGILESFVNKDVLVHNYLIWNSFNQKPKVSKSKEELAVLPKSIHISHSRSLFFFNERLDKLYSVKYAEFLKIIHSLKPWEELDAYLFDESMQWIIAHTHDRDILVIGKP